MTSGRLKDVVAQQPRQSTADLAASCGVSEGAIRAANAALFDLIGKPEWDLRCLAVHMQRFKDS